MTTGMRRTEYGYRYSEKDYLVNERFYPGEFGAVILLGIASLLLWAVAIYGITNEPAPKYDANTSTNATSAY
ncbi:MAG TPA: hypothetical protein V6D22_02075 [Candidatus Obscuribacterales bacterium]